MDITTILALISAFPQALAQIQALWAVIKGTFSNTDQATVDAALDAAKAKVETDIAKLDADVPG